jgi:nucleotide-binding universal stress UspA family protein
MNSIDSLLVPVDASPRTETHLRLAQWLGARCAAASRSSSTVDALYCATPSFADLPLAYAEGAAAALPFLDALYARRHADTRAMFERVSQDAPAPLRWIESADEALVPTVVRRALFADLLILGQCNADDMQAISRPPDFVESVLIASGKPAIVVPYAGRFETLGSTVLIAWKPTRESASAVGAALPLLQRASRIHLVVDDDDRASPHSNRGQLEAYLRAHGVAAAIEPHAPLADHAGGETLLSLAAATGADLLVMGCYGHSRAREMVLGGASRTVLRSMTLPVLMAH